MNDIMFFLLLFFLITSTLVSPNVIKLMLPNAKSGKSVTKKNITLSVSSDLKYFLNNREVNQSDIETDLKSEAGGLTDATVILKVDRTVPVQNLVELLDLGNRLKIKMVLATQTDKK